MKKERVIGVIGNAADVAFFSTAVNKVPGFKALSVTQPQEEVPKTVRIQPSPDGNDEGEPVQGSGLFLSRERSFTMVSPVKGMHTGNIQEMTTASKAGLGTQGQHPQSDQASVAPKHLDLD